MAVHVVMTALFCSTSAQADSQLQGKHGDAVLSRELPGYCVWVYMHSVQNACPGGDKDQVKADTTLSADARTMSSPANACHTLRIQTLTQLQEAEQGWTI